MKKKSRPTEQYIQEHREMIGRRIWALREKRVYSQDELVKIMDVLAPLFKKLKLESLPSVLIIL